jgi:radical SAM superfamily enzyme YgiQ (UPF0313 family)
VVKRCRDCLRVALVYPSLYQAAVASLAYQTAYYLLNSMDYVVAERFVASKLVGEEPTPRSLETGSRLDEFDLIVVFLGFELDYVNAARILLAAGIEPLREKRSEAPPVVIGGPPAGMNPLPYLDFADAILVGEIEPLLPKLVEASYDLGARRALDELACSPGFLSKTCSERVRRVFVDKLDEAFHPVVEFRVPGSGQPWGEAYMVEVARGCPYACSFCMEARYLHPLRVRSAERVLDLVARGVEANRVRRVAFYALSFFDHPDADRILSRTVDEMGLEATLGSLRADTLNEDRIELLARAGQRVLTVAPETLSPRLCRLIAKCVGYEVVESVAVKAWRLGMHVKLYLMVGLPGESIEDVELTARKLRELLTKAPPRREAVRVTVNPLIPKPWTPLQRLPLIGEREYLERIAVLRKIVSSRVAAVEPLSYRYAYAETAIARGDEALARVVREWALLGGRLGQLLQAARRLGVNLDRYVYGRVEPRWMEVVDHGLPRPYHP